MWLFSCLWNTYSWRPEASQIPGLSFLVCRMGMIFLKFCFLGLLSEWSDLIQGKHLEECQRIVIQDRFSY